MPSNQRVRGSARSPLVPPELRTAVPPPKPPRPRPVTLTLQLRHGINGTTYGPGTVTVPFDISRTLIEQEQRARGVEEAFHDRRAYVVDRYLRKIPVAPERFDAVLFNDQMMTIQG